MDDRSARTVLRGYGIQLLGLLIGPLLGFLSVFLLPISYSIVIAATVTVIFLVGGHKYSATLQKKKTLRRSVQ